MKTITVRNIPSALQSAIRERAEKEGLSLSKTVIRLIGEATGLSRTAAARGPRYHDLDHLAGTWSEEEARIFDEHLSEQREIDPELWR